MAAGASSVGLRKRRFRFDFSFEQYTNIKWAQQTIHLNLQ